MREISVLLGPNGFVVACVQGDLRKCYWDGENWSNYHWSYDGWWDAYVIAVSRVLAGDGWLSPSITNPIG